MRLHQKTAVGDAAVAQLQAEAAVLDAMRHPGVVELVGVDTSEGLGELSTVWVEGPTMDRPGPMGPEEVAGVAAALAATLADLHAAGLVHGAVEPSHVILSPDGPVLCGFGQAGPPGPSRQPDGDVVALAELVLTLVREGPVAAVAQRLMDAPGSAAEAASEFRDAVRGATLPGGPAAAGETRLGELLRPAGSTRQRRVVPIVGAVAVVVAAGIALVVARGAADAVPVTVAPSRSVSEPRPTTTTMPAPVPTQLWPRGPAPTIVVGNRRFEVGGPGDIAIGSWGCDAAAPVAAVLRPGTGEVFVFARPATAGQDIVGERVATVVGATSLVAADLDGDRCTDLAVTRTDGEPVAVHLERAS
ncbi:MAG: eukaryotic-like serine/threonine-protein kinase [Actinomycetota bacterium]